MKENYENKSSEEVFLEKLALTKGRKIKLIKRHIFTSSNVPIGTEMEGILDKDIKWGEPIYLDNGTKTISRISGAGENKGQIFLKTNTSAYELIVLDNSQNETIKIITKQDSEEQMRIFSAKGYGEWDVMGGKVPPQDDPTNMLISQNGFNEGDKVIFFAEKEREGILQKDHKGVFNIRDKNNNPWGIQGLLNATGGYIKKA